MNGSVHRRRYKLVNTSSVIVESEIKGELGGYRRGKYRIYSRLDCPNALMHIVNGNYVKYRVFFVNEETAISAGYRPCFHCMREKYDLWKEAKPASLI